MARPKQVDDTTLISLIDQFFIHECKGNPSRLKKPEIAQYVSKHGYPNYAVTTLRRNKVACDYIDALTKKEQDKKITLLAAYKTLDVENFLTTHQGKASLTKALTELDCYYKTIVDSSVATIKERKDLDHQINTLQNSLMDANIKISSLSQIISELKQEIKELTIENKRLKGIVEDYVYPDVCNELLSQDKQLRNIDTIIDEKKLHHKIITFKSKIETVPSQIPPSAPIVSKSAGSSVIQGLTDIFEEDDE